MVTLELLQSLNEHEKKLLDFVIKNHRRSTLRKLYGYLKKQGSSKRGVNKHKLFPLVFEAPYHKNKDYLLRNELRLLNQEIYEVIVQNQVRAYRKTAPYFFYALLIEGLQAKKLGKLITQNYTRFSAEAYDAKDYDNTYRLMEGYLKYLMNYPEITTNLYYKIRGLLDQQIDVLKRATLTKLRRTELKRAVVERTLRVTEKDIKHAPLHTTFELTNDAYNDYYTRYLFLRSLAYQNDGNRKIDFLQQALKYLRKTDRECVQKIEEEVGVRAAMALAYFLMGKYAKAASENSSALRLMERNGITPDAAFLINYISTLAKYGNYKHALSVMEKYEARLDETPRIACRHHCLRAMCHIFQNEPALAAAQVPDNITQHPEPQYHYFRFILSMIFYLDGQHDMADREMYNFHQALKRKQKVEFDIRPMILLFRRFYGMAFSTRGDKLKWRKLKELDADIRAERKGKPAEYRDYLPLLWLRDKVAEMLKAKSAAVTNKRK